MRRGAALPLDRQCQLAGLPIPTAEYLFAKHLDRWQLRAIGQERPRLWAIDWAFLDARIGIEVEGGFFMQGRHSRGAGTVKDMEKYNTLALLGWRLLRVTPRDIASGAALRLIELAFPKS